jgi:Na+:H+ antiporter
MIEDQIAWFVLLLLVAALVATATERLRIPYVVALAVVGAAFSPLLSGRIPKLDHSLILFVFLPGLLFEAAYRLRWRHLRDNLVAVAVLSTAGVLLTTLLVGTMAHAALALPISAAALFGAAVAPTDPVAVVATFRRLGVPSRLANLIEAESLLNDGTGVVVFSIALTAGAATAFAPLGALVDFLRLAGGGLALGLAFGLVLSRVTGYVDNAQVEMSLTALAAYAGYLLGESLHVSGILTVVGAALVIGNYGRPRRMSERTQSALAILWDYAAFVLNSAAFLLMGASAPWVMLLHDAPLALAGAAIALGARAVSVYALLNLLRPLGRTIGFRWQHLMVWGGMRGAVALALALSLSGSDPTLRTVRALVYGVVLSSIVVQGLTVGPLTRRVLPHADPGREDLDHDRLTVQ